MADNDPRASLTVNITGDAPNSRELLDELHAAFEGSVEPARVMGVGLHEIARYAVEWGPVALVWLRETKPAFDAVKAGLEIAGKVIDLIKKRPGIIITIPTRNGPIKVEDSNRVVVAQVIAAELDSARRPR